MSTRYPTPPSILTNISPTYNHSSNVRKGAMAYNSETMTEVNKLLSQCIVNATFLERSLSDNGYICRRLSEIQQSLESRQQDLDFYMTRVSTPYSIDSPTTAVSISPNTIDPSPTTLSHCVFELFRSIGVLNETLKKYKGVAFFLSFRRKSKCRELTSSIQEAWLHLLVQLSLSISRASSEAAEHATGNIHKLAIVTGTPDWNHDFQMQDQNILFYQGDKLFHGYNGTRIDYELAFKRYQSASRLGHPEATFMLGLMYENGFGRVKDLTLAIETYKRAAELNHHEAYKQLGVLFHSGKGCRVNYTEAIKMYKKAIEGGNLDAMLNYAIIMMNGDGCDVDSKSAIDLLIRASDLGDFSSQNFLGKCYYFGNGVDVDYYNAVQLFKKSSDQGCACAHNNLGICYEEGNGIGKDLVQAKHYYNLAADLKHPNGTNNFAYMLLIEEQYAKAKKLFNFALSLGSIDAAYNLGKMYEAGCMNSKGEGVSMNLETACNYYMEAADKGCVKSQLRLSNILISNPEPIGNYSKAVKYLNMASEEKEKDDKILKEYRSNAQNMMGEILELGYGDIEADEATAAEWYRKAVKNGNARAAFNYAVLLEEGLGVERDLEKALKFYIEADKWGSEEARQRLAELQELDLSIRK